MSIGLEMRGSDGSVVFSTTDVTWNFLGVYTSAANTNATHTGVPSMPERLVSRLMVNQLTGDDEAYAHTYSLSGTTLTTTAPSSTDTVGTLFLVFGR